MDLSTFDLNLLVVMDALLKHRSVTQAARRLGISQPTASAALTRLREQFADELFVRQGRLLAPTPRALVLGEAIAQVLDAVQEQVFQHTGFDAASSTRTFTVLCGELGQAVFVPRLLQRLRSRAPRCALRVVYPDPASHPAVLEDDLADIALGFLPGLGGANLFQQLLYAKPLVCVGRQGHPALQDGGLSTAAFQAADHARVAMLSHLDGSVEPLLAAVGVRRRVVLELAHISGVPQVLMASDLLAIVPEVMAADWARLWPVRPVPMPVPVPPYAVRLYWHRKVHNDPAVRWLRAQVADEFGAEARA
jgi:DNA-binding transcriptional LysR family regulator